MGKRVKTPAQKEADRVLSTVRRNRVKDDPEFRERQRIRSSVSLNIIVLLYTYLILLYFNFYCNISCKELVVSDVPIYITIIPVIPI